ncbi:MAG: cell division protein ZapA [Bryobacteraceae bacterium]
MDAAVEKKQVRVTIMGQSITLLTGGDLAEMVELAHQVDELMTGIASRSQNLDSTRVAVLACLHLADQLRNVESEFAGWREIVDQKAREFSGILNRVIDG